MVCGGIFILLLMLINMLLAPKRPVNRGSRGWFKLRFSDANPKNPARRKIITAKMILFFCFSWSIKYIEMRIRIIGIILIT